MVDSRTLALFLAAGVVLVAIPGPNHLYILARSIGEGRRSGVVSALGIQSGTLVHIAAFAAGLSYLVAQSQPAFRAVKYAGAGYLLYLGVRTLRSRQTGDVAPMRAQRLRRVYLEGILVNVLNPKVVLFFLAFMPQFIDPDSGSVPAQVLTLGLLLCMIGLSADLLYAICAGSIGGWLRARPSFARYQRCVTGTAYLVLAAVTVLTGQHARRAGSGWREFGG
jgi:threonine/homoserine/homoserine lactone efflux protein